MKEAFTGNMAMDANTTRSMRRATAGSVPPRDVRMAHNAEDHARLSSCTSPVVLLGQSQGCPALRIPVSPMLMPAAAYSPVMASLVKDWLKKSA